MEDIKIYILGLLNTMAILLLWFQSPLKYSIAEIFFKSSPDTSLDDILAVYSQKLATLSGCYICFSFWTSLVIGIAYMFIFGANYIFPLITFFTYPPLCYIYKVYVLEKHR